MILGSHWKCTTDGGSFTVEKPTDTPNTPLKEKFITKDFLLPTIQIGEII